MDSGKHTATEHGELAALQQRNRRLESAVEELEMLTQIASAVSSNESVRSTIEFVVRQCVKRLRVEQGDIRLFEEENKKKPLQTVYRQASESRQLTAFSISDQILGWMLKHNAPLLINDTRKDDRLRTVHETHPSVRSLLRIPLRFNGKFTGLLTVINKKSEDGFTAEDERLLGLIATQAAPILQTVRLLDDLRKERTQLSEENENLWRHVQTDFSSDGIIGAGEAMQRVLTLIAQIRDTSVDVLITGESGTGKELIAKTIHFNSPRARCPFIAMNCAALPENLVESELFGIEKGVATGVDKRLGQFEAANSGTLFLDEIGDLNLSAQAKILRVLQERTVRRVGGRAEIPVDVRVLAATNKDLDEEIKNDAFREDLLYRLNVIHLHLPALRERRSDIVELAHWFLRTQSKALGFEPVTISEAAEERLRTAPWPGNVRQVQNEMKRLAICVRGRPIEVEDLSPGIRMASESVGVEDLESGGSLEDAMGNYEKRLLEEALAKNDYNQAKTAWALGLSRQGLFKKLKRFGVQTRESAASG